MPVSSTGPIPENLIKRSSRVPDVLGNVAEPPVHIPPLDNPTERQRDDNSTQIKLHEILI